MKKSILLIIFMLLMVSPSLAIVKHSTETIIDYKKYYTLIQKYPQSKYYHFEFAIILASMGKIESAGKEFNIINQIDESYANKMVNYLENQVKLKPDWKNYFRLGFCYYFLFDDLNGRLELAERRSKRAKEKGDKVRVREQQKIIKELAPQANHYYQRALICFQKTAIKKPIDGINAMAYAYQAVIKSKIKSWNEAKALCEKALAISPDSYAIRAAFAETLRQTGNIISSTGEISAAFRLKEEQVQYEQELLGKSYVE